MTRAEGWLIDLRGADRRWDDASCRADLSAEELRRAAGIRDREAAVTYVRARSTVRRLLARMLGESPAALRIASAPGGRPVLPDHPDSCVSWSRSAGVLLLAVRRGEPIGVDVEAVRPVRSGAAVLRTVYRKELPAGGFGEPETFFSAWTLLEAAVKATGRGLARGAHDVLLYRPPGARRYALGGIRDGGALPWSGRTDQFRAPGSAACFMTAVVARGPCAPVRLNAWQPGVHT